MRTLWLIAGRGDFPVFEFAFCSRARDFCEE